MYNYLISGLPVSSEIELPGAIATAGQTEDSAVSIRYASVAAALDDAAVSGEIARGPTWEMAGETFLLRVPRVARFLITAGREIALELEPDSTARDAAGFVLGTAFGILLHQRGAMVLHGAAAAKDGRAMAICGVSGAGKSTLAAALCREGYSFVTDDICVIGLNAAREPVVWPDGRQLKLWAQSIKRLDLGERRGEAVRDSFEKYYVTPCDRALDRPRLSAIYVLREARPPFQEGLERLTLPDALRRLDYEAYRPGLRAKIGQRPEMLSYAATVLGHAKVFMLSRPRGFEHLPETVAALNAHWDALG